MIFATPLPLKDQYNGTITLEEASQGIALAIDNSKLLLKDARLLFDNHSYPRAIALSVLAIEEAGKVYMIKNLLLSTQRIHSLWKELRNHKSKNFHWVFPMLKRMGVTDEEVIMSFTNKLSDSAVFLDQLKQICFYTEAIKVNGKCNWWHPSVITDRATAKVYLDIANEVVFDDGILWTVEALGVFKSFASYEDGEVSYSNILAYYQALFDGGHITEDRFKKIYANLIRLNSKERI
jgi:AbiV family abortive infection protein